jgi:hypothetical protein
MFDVDSSKGLPYNFAHLALPILVLMNPRKFYTDISGSNNVKYLNTMWQGLAGRLGVRQTSVDFQVTKNALQEGIEIFAIKLPEPTKVPDAFLVSAVFQFKNSSTGKEIDTARYFTLEFGKSPYDQSTEYHFCEWIGNVLSGRQHKNYGRLENPNVTTFIKAINEVLFVGKLIAPQKEKLPEPQSKPVSEMSELEQMQFAKDKLLPAMREAALEQLEKRDAVMKETMAYVEKATRERDRNIAMQKVFLVGITLIILAVICYLS